MRDNRFWGDLGVLTVHLVRDSKAMLVLTVLAILIPLRYSNPNSSRNGMILLRVTMTLVTVILTSILIRVSMTITSTLIINTLILMRNRPKPQTLNPKP